MSSYYQRNKEKLQEYYRHYYQKNKEKYKAQKNVNMDNYYQRNKEKLQEYYRNYYQKNKEKIQAQRRLVRHFRRDHYKYMHNNKIDITPSIVIKKQDNLVVSFN